MTDQVSHEMNDAQKIEEVMTMIFNHDHLGLKAFLSEGFDANTRLSPHHDSFLHAAARRHAAGAMEILLQYRAAPNVVNAAGETPLGIALHKELTGKGMLSMTSLLVKAGADADQPMALGKSIYPTAYVFLERVIANTPYEGMRVAAADLLKMLQPDKEKLRALQRKSMGRYKL